MKICVICSGFSSIFGGLESVYKQLGELWTEKHHDVVIISGFGPIPNASTFKVLKVPFIPRKFFETFLSLFRKFLLDSYELEGLSCVPFMALRLIKLKPDIVLSNTRFETIVPLKLGFPCVMVSQAAIQDRMNLFERVNRVIVNDLHSYRRLKSLNIKTELILNGAMPPGIQNTDTYRLRIKHSIPNGSKVILTVARLYSRKRIHLLINAFHLIKQPAVLIIIGDGPELPSLKKQALQCTSQNKVVFLKYVPQQELDEFYQLCDVFTLPSEHEGMPMVLLEALCFGKTVVTNPAPEKKLILGKFGVFTNVEDPRLYSESLLRAVSIKIDVNSADYIQHMHKFNWETIASKYVQVFEHILRESPE